MHACAWESRTATVVVAIVDFARGDCPRTRTAAIDRDGDGTGRDGQPRSAIRKSLIRADVNLGGVRCAVIVTPAGDRRQREQFRSVVPRRPVCAEVLTNRSRFRVRNGAICHAIRKRALATRARDARRDEARGSATRATAVRPRCKSPGRYSLFVSARRVLTALIYLNNRRCRSRAQRGLFMTLLKRAARPARRVPAWPQPRLVPRAASE